MVDSILNVIGMIVMFGYPLDEEAFFIHSY
jgi:hypothetical protein